MKTSRGNEIVKRLSIIVPLVIAVVIAGKLVKSKKGPQQKPLKEISRHVRVITAGVVDVVPSAKGYGTVLPGQVWQAVAQVSGKVVEMSPDLEQGVFLKQGNTLLKIDPVPYELAVAQAEANIRQIEAQIMELDMQEKNQTVSLGIEDKSLQLSQKERDRYEKLLKQGTAASTQFEQAEKAYYAQLSKVQNLKNTLNLIPASRKALQATLALNQARLKDAKLNLKDTIITVPYACRVTTVTVEISQFVQKGQLMFTADGVETAEIAAQIPMMKMAALLSKGGGHAFNPTMMDMQALRDTLGLDAVVRVRDGNLEARWPARFARADATIDPQTRTMGIIVAVDQPYEKVMIGKRPPLVRNMFCEVEVRGKHLPGRMIIPRSALHEGRIYVMNPQNRLEIRDADIAFSQNDFLVLKTGLEAGEKIVVSDLVPAVAGMLLEPVEDTVLMEKLKHQAAGSLSGSEDTTGKEDA